MHSKLFTNDSFLTEIVLEGNESLVFFMQPLASENSFLYGGEVVCNRMFFVRYIYMKF